MQRMHSRNLYIGTTVERTALSLPADGIGAMFYDTDTGFVYFWDGSNWDSFNSDSAFTDLTDVPASYTGESGKLVKVKADESGLEFVAPSAGSGDVTGPAGATSGNIPTFADATGKVIDGGIPPSDFEPAKGADDNYVTDVEKAVIALLSGTNTGDQQGDGITITGAGTPGDPFVAASGSGDVAGPAGAAADDIVLFNGATGKLIKDSGTLLSAVALKSNVLQLDNTSAFTPDADYEPATKKYVDDLISPGEGHINISPFAYSAIGAGDWAGSYNASSAPNTWYLSQATPANNDNISYKVYLAKGTYTFLLYHHKNATGGIMDIDIDSTEIGSVDQYAAGVTWGIRYTVAEIAIATSGIKTLKFRMDGKNANSSSYKGWIVLAALWRTA